MQDILYRDSPGDDWAHLPPWADWLAFLGTRVGGLQPDARRLLVAVSLPARPFAAALCTFGCVLAQLTRATDNDEHEHLERLRELPSGTWLNDCQGARCTRCQLVEFSEDASGKEFIVLRTAKKDISRLPASLAQRIRIASQKGKRLPEKPKTEVMSGSSMFAQAMLGRDLLLADQSVGCAVVAQKTGQKRDLLEMEFAIRVEDRVQRGCLNDIARIREFTPAAELSLSSLYASQGRPTGDEAPTRVAIFDGARAFENWHEVWPDASWIVLLDRTEPGFESGMTLVDDYFRRGGSRDGNAVVKREPPVGIEFVTIERDNRR